MVAVGREAHPGSLTTEWSQMVAVGREAHPRITENLAQIDPEGCRRNLDQSQDFGSY